MPLLNQTALVLIGLLLAAWTVGAGWLVLDARRRVRRSEAWQRQARRLGRMVDESISKGSYESVLGAGG